MSWTVSAFVTLTTLLRLLYFSLFFFYCFLCYLHTKHFSEGGQATGAECVSPGGGCESKGRAHTTIAAAGRQPTVRWARIPLPGRSLVLCRPVSFSSNSNLLGSLADKDSPTLRPGNTQSTTHSATHPPTHPWYPCLPRHLLRFLRGWMGTSLVLAEVFGLVCSQHNDSGSRTTCRMRTFAAFLTVYSGCPQHPTKKMWKKGMYAGFEAVNRPCSKPDKRPLQIYLLSILKH